MTTESTASSENPEPDQDDLLKKRTGSAADLPRVVVSTACEVLGGISRASAEAFSTLNQHVTPEQIATSSLPAKLVEGVLRGNARFFEELSQSTERVADAMKPHRKS